MIDTITAGPASPLRVCFLFNAQRHQLLHGIATAVELARLPGHEVHVASPSSGHLEYAARLVARMGGAPIVFCPPASGLLEAARRLTGGAVPPKLATLLLWSRWLDRFDAIALPERTSILLRTFGVRRPRFIHVDHGAGDRAAGFDPRIRKFDLVLMAGDKHLARMIAEGLVHPGGYSVVGYPKFDAADAARDPGWTPFSDDRPVVLYNPHFSRLGSWQAMGEQVMAAFARQDRYNLIVAPHVRLLDGARGRATWAPRLARFAGCPNIHVDPGSDRSVDMTYVELADIYVGDVSSQVYEFLRSPRPCLFLDPHDVSWEADENYAHWRFGPVLRSTNGLIAAVDAARREHPRYRRAQEDGFSETFAMTAVSGATRAANAVAGYLRPLRRDRSS